MKHNEIMSISDQWPMAKYVSNQAESKRRWAAGGRRQGVGGRHRAAACAQREGGAIENWQAQENINQCEKIVANLSSTNGCLVANAL